MTFNYLFLVKSDAAKQTVLTANSQQAVKKSQPFATLEFFQLPKKYQRRPLSSEEVDAINVMIFKLFKLSTYQQLNFQ